METVLAFAAIFGAAYFVTIICAAFVTALKISPAPAVAINSSKMVKIKYRRDHWILIAFTLEDTNWNLRTQVVYLVMNWKFSLQQKQKHQKNCATCWSVTSLMRVFYRSKRKNQFNCLLVLGNNHHLLPLLQLWHPSHSGWCRRRDWSRFRLRKLLQTNQREGNSWSWRSGRDWDGLSFSLLDKKFPEGVIDHHFSVCRMGHPHPPPITDQYGPNFFRNGAHSFQLRFMRGLNQPATSQRVTQ